MNPVTDRRGACFSLPVLAMGLLLGACTVIPAGPSVMAIPGSRKGVDQYQADNATCQQYAGAVVAAAGGGTAAAADSNAASTAATGAVLGAATGAIIGSATGQAGQGAAVGAGAGLLVGAAAGSSYTAMSSYQLQRGYDSAYLQCMYERGHRVPVRQAYSGGPSRPVYLNSASTPSKLSAAQHAAASRAGGHGRADGLPGAGERAALELPAARYAAAVRSPAAQLTRIRGVRGTGVPPLRPGPHGSSVCSLQRGRRRACMRESQSFVRQPWRFCRTWPMPTCTSARRRTARSSPRMPRDTCCAFLPMPRTGANAGSR